MPTTTQLSPLEYLDSITPLLGDPDVRLQGLTLEFEGEIPFTYCDDYSADAGCYLGERTLDPLEFLIASQPYVSYLAVKEYVEKILRGETIDPVQVLEQEDGTFLIWDGHHRATAHWLLDRPVLCDVYFYIHVDNAELDMDDGDDEN